MNLARGVESIDTSLLILGLVVHELSPSPHGLTSHQLNSNNIKIKSNINSFSIKIMVKMEIKVMLCLQTITLSHF